MNQIPLVSVIIPSYNHGTYIEKAIKSVWKQSYRNIQLIVIDDGSRDNSWEIIERLSKNPPLEMVIEKQKNQGLCITLNKGIQKSKGELIAILASDDYYHKQFVEHNITKYLQRTPGEIRVLHSDSYIVNEQTEQILKKTGFGYSNRQPLTGVRPLEKAISGKYKIIAPTMVVPKEAFEIVGYYDEKMVAEDFDMYLRLSKVANFHYIPKPLIYKRRLINSLGSNVKSWHKDIFTAISKHEDQFTSENYTKIVSNKYLELSVHYAYKGDLIAYRNCAKKAIVNASSIHAKVYYLISSLRIFLIHFTKGMAKRIIPTRVHANLRDIVK